MPSVLLLTVTISLASEFFSDSIYRKAGFTTHHSSTVPMKKKETHLVTTSLIIIKKRKFRIIQAEISILRLP